MTVLIDDPGGLRAHAERQAEKARRAAKRREAALVIFFAVQMIALTALQKIAMPISGSFLQVALPILYASLAILMFFALPRVDLTRLLLFAAFVGAATASALNQTGAWSVNSFLVAIAIYAPMVLRFDVEERLYRRFLSVFLNLMIVFGVIEIIEMLVQVTYGPTAFPNMNEMVSSDYLATGYNYLQPINYGMEIQKPNAFFFLEVSFLSQFLAIAFALELVYFRRIWRLAFYAATILITFAGTGVLLLAVCAPLLLGRVTLRTMFALLVVVVIAYAVAVYVGWYDQVHDRFFEFQKSNSSANHRFIEPLVQMVNYIRREPNFLFQGIGPGNIYNGKDQVPWPSTKVCMEYGFGVGILFYTFLVHSMFRATPSRRISFMLLVWYSFFGTFATPIHPFVCLMFTCLFRVAPNRETGEAPADAPAASAGWGNLPRRLRGLSPVRSAGV